MLDLCSNGYFDGDLWLDGERSDLAHRLAIGNHVDHALVDAHDVTIPGLGTLTIRGLTGSDLQLLGRHANWALDRETPLLSVDHNLGTCRLQLLWVRRSEGDADAMLLSALETLFLFLHDDFGELVTW
eukprot:m.4365 g.4365  ORF g.4365 m.4365 type:complete len:128 (-) comp2218_c0_seq1:67-450(-)